MAEKRKKFTFIWKIKNFTFNLSSGFLESPSFYVHAMEGTKYDLILSPKVSHSGEWFTCYCRRKVDPGPVQVDLDYELSFLDGDGRVLQSKMILKEVFKKGNSGKSFLLAKRDEVFLHKKDLSIIPNDTLIIRCRIWGIQKSLSESRKCCAETQMVSERRSFVGIIVGVSRFKPEIRYPVHIQSSTEGPSFSVKLQVVVTANGLLNIDVKPIDYKPHTIYYRCKIFILDKIGHKATSDQGKFYDKETHSIPLTLSKEYLIKNKEYFLPHDELTIQCEIEATGKIIEQIEYMFDSEDNERVVTNIRTADESSEENHVGNLTTLKTDLISLFKEGILCDTKLKTDTETFPAHTTILSARSPVFRSMFTTDMKEKTNNCVNIDDLDADTVRRMLVFMYSDTLDDLKYKSAKSLYFAADKYDIVSLTGKCSNFLKQNLCLSNCCEVLILADTHHDTGLKNAVLDYIAKNDKTILSSDKWKNLEKNHPQLAIEVFRFIYMKIRQN